MMAYYPENDEYDHVIPRGDLREHVLSTECWCKPTDLGSVWMHHAMDMRELYESGQLELH